MNISYRKLLSIFVLTFGLIVSVTVSAADVQVTSADPATGNQGTVNLDVAIGGKGFDNSAAVRFLVTGTENPGGVAVNHVTYIRRNKLIANIDISDTAVIDDFDIEVRLSTPGRGGKGTTLFRVQPKNNIYTCKEVFALADPANCSCEFTLKDESNQQGTPPLLLWDLQGNCDTSETLVIRPFEQIGNSQGATLTAVNPSAGSFVGSSVVAAAGHRAAATGLNIHIGPDVAAGCAGGELRSALAFVLDDHSTDPFATEFINTWWTVARVTVSHASDPLCHALEFSRMDSYDSEYPGTTDARVNVHTNIITVGSYEKTGILFRGFERVDDKNNLFLKVSRNTISAAATGMDADANAIQFGPIFGVGSVERNLITLGGGTGVLVLGDGFPTDISIIQNDVEGAFVAVLVDINVTDATIKSNILTGANDTGSAGICSDATNNTIRANKIKDYVNNVLEVGCTALASPAN